MASRYLHLPPVAPQGRLKQPVEHCDRTATVINERLIVKRALAVQSIGLNFQHSFIPRGRDDEAARRWEEFQGRDSSEKHTGIH